MSIWRSPHDSHTQGSQKKKSALLGAIALSLFAFLLQIAGAWYTGSIALLGDSAHLMTDLFSLIMSLVAVVLASRPATHARSFGLYRLEVLASFLNGLLLFAVSLGLAREGIIRILYPEPVLTRPLMIVATIGLLFTLASAFLLLRASKDGEIAHHHHHGHDHGHYHAHEHHDHHGHAHHDEKHHHDRNLHSALLHVWSDALGSVAVIAGAIVMELTGIFWIDAAVGIMLALWIFRWAIRVIFESGHVLLESTPRHIEIEKVVRALKATDARVGEIEDLHVWELTSRMYAATAEVRVQKMTLEEAEKIRQSMHQVLHDQFGIAHPVLAVRPS